VSVQEFCFVSVNEFSDRLRRILADYEAKNRLPQRIMEIIAYLVREYDECPDMRHGPFEQIRLTVNSWDHGDRPDVDALETIAVLARQF
jgi:hypothetical protein